MKEHKVKFVIKPGGQIQMDVENGEGEECVNVTRSLELSLSNGGGEKVDEGKKPEYYNNSHLTGFNDLTS